MVICRIALHFAVALAVVAPPAVLPALAMADTPYATPTRDGRERIPRTGICPTGYVGLGQFCEALHRDTPHAYPKIKGVACPAGTFTSGDACKAFR